MKKRLLAYLLCITMLMGLLPTMAFAATTLTNVGITGIDAPVADASPDYNAQCNDSVYIDSGNNNSSYYKNGITWYDLTSDYNVTTSSKFVAGHQYKVMVFINTSDGFTFADNVQITINNLPCTSIDRYSDDLIVAELVFDAIPTQSPVTLLEYYTDHSLVAGNPLETVTLVRINNNPDFFDIIDNWDGEWYYNDEKTDNIGDYEKVSGSVYTGNTAYAYVITATLKGDNIFTNETQLYFSTCNKSYTVTPSNVSADKKTATFHIFLDKLSSQPISSVAYTLNGYAEGSPINAITIDSTSPVKTDGVYGTDYFITIANRVPIMTGDFAYDTTYTLYIKVASDVYDVSALTKYNITLNGKQATTTEVVGGKLFAIFYLPQLQVSQIEIYSIMLATEVLNPTANGALYYPTPYAANGDEELAGNALSVPMDENHGWYQADYFVPTANYKYIEPPKTFENGKAYMFYGTVFIEDGYYISDECAILVSTPDGLWGVEIVDRGSDYISFEYYFNLGAPTQMPKAETARVSISGYQQGKNVADSKVTISVNGKEHTFPDNNYGVFYGIKDKNGKFITEGTFEYDTDYTLLVILAVDCYDFSSLKAENVLFANTHADSIEYISSFAVASFKLPQLKKQLPNPFTDVKQGKFYYDSVLWAVENGITAGITPTTFEPNSTCTRAQVVSFLWRAAGSPEPKTTTNPFTDVKEKAYYYKAVLWAVENGITAGVTPTTFAPNDNCTRGQIVAFLWRSQGSPKVKSANPFTDVKQKAYYFDAVIWAGEHGITAGVTPTTFEPNSPCTRGQIVSFLYRCLNKS